MRGRTRLWVSISIPVLLLVIILGAYFWQQRAVMSSNTTTSNTSKTPLTTVRLALDWTPNTNHTGIFVAEENHWYQQEGINLQILPYSANVTPDTLVTTGKADVGISSTEQIVSDAAVGQPVVSIAAIVEHNTSGLAVLSSSGITNPKQLDGKVYGAFGAPYETPVISQVIKHNGGTGNFKSVTIDIDPIQALQSHRVDFVWVFAGAEGIQAKDEGIKLNFFPISSNGIPDYSTPDLITSPTEAAQKADLLKRFMAATAKGYEYARQHPQQAAQDLIAANPKGTFPDQKYVFDSQDYLSPRYADSGQQWGLQTAASWTNYPQFIVQHDGVTDAAGNPVHSINYSSLYTNKFLPGQ
jgi:ABC-type nitrate/sulfonate/bicarbonate transport system substrate-binding protein